MAVVTTSPLAAPPTTTDALVSCVRRKTNDYPIEDYLTAPYTAGGATLTVAGTAWAPGDVWEFDDGTREIIYVRTFSAPTVTPKFGHLASPTSIDHAVNAVLRKRPRFTEDEINDALIEATSGLWPTVYGVTTATQVPWTTGGKVNSNAPVDAERLVYAVQPDAASSANDYRYHAYAINGQPTRPEGGTLRLFLVQGQSIAQYTSGKTLYFPDGFYNTTQNVTITYAYKPTIGTVAPGLMTDAVCWGAVASLLGSGGVQRTHPKGKADDPSVLDNLRAGANAQAKADIAKRRLASELRINYPMAKTWRL